MPPTRVETTLSRQFSLLDPASGNNQEGCHDRLWWTIYSRAKQEKTLALQLHQWRIPFYLPLAPHEFSARGRSQISRLPLFSNFLFLFCSKEECLSALSTRRVSRILPVDDGECLRRNLLHVHQLIEAGSSLTVETRVASGADVRIEGGPLSGVEGTLIERSGGDRLLVAVEEIGQGVSVSVDHLPLESVLPITV